jgi:hypothetical protein
MHTIIRKKLFVFHSLATYFTTQMLLTSILVEAWVQKKWLPANERNVG